MGPVWLLMSAKVDSFELKLRSNKLVFFHFSYRKAEFHHSRVDLLLYIHNSDLK